MIRFCGRSVRTKTIDDRLDPRWYETLYFDDVRVPEPLEYAPKIYCEIFDADYGCDDSLGRFTVKSHDIYRETEEKMEIEIEENHEIEPIWYKLEDAEGRRVDGEVLVAFELVDFEPSNFWETDPIRMNSRKLMLRPPVIETFVNIITLGLRDIQSVLGVNKPFIEFECNGKKYKTETSNHPSSRNPNFCHILNMKLKLPEDPRYAPCLNLTLKDSVC